MVDLGSPVIFAISVGWVDANLNSIDAAMVLGNANYCQFVSYYVFKFLRL